MAGEIEFPDHVDPDLQHLAQMMLLPDIDSRLGIYLVKVEEDDEFVVRNLEVRDHPFMSQVPWDAVKKRTLLVSHSVSSVSTIPIF